ncbi:hypothetical protein [Nocardia sp. NRRL S-836]|uniref:hypothetical protein n=1 Tax=Nocardia sp. NRRL S-836 TaxID=1519492 RepID=UPI0012FA2103|nr:hypothetical protein [Nocardia sp. NRRL S-836]
MDPDNLKSILDEQTGIAELLAEAFEFDVSRGGDPGDFEISSGVEMRKLAGDFSGGTFLACGPVWSDCPVLYVSSEGQAGMIARNIKDALEILILLPCWHDCLSFSRGGNMETMKVTAAYSLRDLNARNPGVEDAQIRAVRAFSLNMPEVTSLVARLHAAVSSTWPGYVISDVDGEYESLFGQFGPERNPKWE